ncbi:cupin domain-containing protein [Echinicola vietnamensis]|uniref:Cupin domain-containing protein n=1 Tax=Echinicola vietnamensis (strain DSM 17526 / LMG 23754 / KMM 6221) TaxID=926556 RepID=L0G6J5_ECHVK|nr:cupin domain-containing protein [Echinicola vietnamensis]AGA80470.1 cupin domain-containing protein [Echinicola vietnamensis DSM 17526]
MKEKDEPIVLKTNEGRTYKMGTMTAVFKADEDETSNKYSISEWWLEPNSEGPGAHQHEENDEIFYGIEGTTSILVGVKWIDIEKGAFLRIPAKTIHDFANRTDEKCGVLNFFIPGGFERNMPSIVKWFEENENE